MWTDVCFAGEFEFNADSIRQLQAHSLTDNVTYAYQFSNLFHAPGAGFLDYPSWAKTSADHGDEVPFVWGALLARDEYKNLSDGKSYRYICNLSMVPVVWVLGLSMLESYGRWWSFKTMMINVSFGSKNDKAVHPFIKKYIHALPALSGLIQLVLDHRPSGARFTRLVGQVAGWQVSLIHTL